MSLNENSKTVVYRGEHFHPTLDRNFDVAGPLEWIARITAHQRRERNRSGLTVRPGMAVSAIRESYSKALTEEKAACLKA